MEKDQQLVVGSKRILLLAWREGKEQRLFVKENSKDLYSFSGLVSTDSLSFSTRASKGRSSLGMLTPEPSFFLGIQTLSDRMPRGEKKET